MSLAVYVYLFFWNPRWWNKPTLCTSAVSCCCLGVTCMYSVHTPCHTAVVQFSKFYLYAVFSTKPAFSREEFNAEIMHQFFKQLLQPSVKIYVAVSVLSPFIQRKYLKSHQIMKWKANPYIDKPKWLVRKYSKKEVTPDLQKKYSSHLMLSVRFWEHANLKIDKELHCTKALF